MGGRLLRRVAAVWIGLAAIAVGLAQEPQAISKPLAFDVISVRENKSAPVQGPPVFGPTGDGYRAMNVSLILALLTAGPSSPMTGLWGCRIG